MRRAYNCILVTICLTGCARSSQPPLTPAGKTPTIDVQSVLPKWQFSNSTVTAGGTTAGLHQSTSLTTEGYEKVWEFYAERAGFAPNYKADALEVSSDCSRGPCIARAVTSSNTPTARSVTFSHRTPEAGIVATIRRAESANRTEIQLTIIAH